MTTTEGAAGSLFEVGERVAVEFDAKWYNGTVTHCTISKRQSLKYSVEFDDGDRLDDTDPVEMRRLHANSEASSDEDRVRREGTEW